LPASRLVPPEQAASMKSSAAEAQRIETAPPYQARTLSAAKNRGEAAYLNFSGNCFAMASPSASAMTYM
jgi:hypothetical protein